MPVEQLYVTEMIVNKIYLEPYIKIEDIDKLCVSFKFAKFINFDIDTQFFNSPTMEDTSEGKTIQMSCGKCFLFVAKPSNLRSILLTDPYKITLYDGNKTVGTTSVPWKKEFSEMVKFFESLGIVKSTNLTDVYKLYDSKNIFTAKIEVFLRLSCFGQNVQTLFQIVNDGPQPEYIFRESNTSKIFKVQKHEDERCQPLVAPLYSGITDIRDTPTSKLNLKENVSLTKLFERDNLFPKDSTYQAPDKVIGDEGIQLNFLDDLDKVSICFRPSENKFFDLLNFISADVKTSSKKTEVTFEKMKYNRMNTFVKSVGGSLKDSKNITMEEEEDVCEMTADKIAKKLCGNKDCPAVQKFKEYGIGPLATGKGLGTVYGDVEPPVTYGMSHTYGTFREYGPYGMFSRPKQEDLPFVPRIDGDEVIPANPRKVTQEDDKRSKSNKRKKGPEWHSKSCPLCPDRLRGGADNDVIINQTEDDMMLSPKSPMIECKSIMDQFDSILAEYKKALGPCGHATCPYAQTIAEDTCKKMCEQPLVRAKEPSSMSCDDDPCNVDGCPYAEDPKKKRYPAGCGSPKCAYTKYKLGLLDDDAELELQFLPPALSANCGDPRCKYPLPPDLPPIHWDCPDPLPKGPCRNLNCPFQPPPLKKFTTKKQLKTGPCGSPMCPYTFPQPCGNPTCPFTMRPCPMVQNQNEKPNKKKCPYSDEEENVCENPECPFSEANANKETEGMDDPIFKGEFQECSNPDCPFNKKDKNKKKQKQKKESFCENPDCSFNQQQKKNEKEKKKKKNASVDSICSNPECPDRKKENGKEKKRKKNASVDSICSNPECPDRKKENGKEKKRKKNASIDSICSNPECPFRIDKNKQFESSTSESASICSNPECAYAELKNKKGKRGNGSQEESCIIGDENSICSNPDCPQRQKQSSDQKDSLCNIPGCPYSKKLSESPCNDPNCPYLKPLPSCGISNCPYEPIPLDYSCENPKCPTKSLDFGKKAAKNILGAGDKAYNANRENTKTGVTNNKIDEKVCEDASPCESPAECENPDCDINVPKTDQNKQIALQKGKKKKTKRKTKGKFVYSLGDTYPVDKLGHKECVTPVFNVPSHMGWLWNIFTPMLSLKPRRGWRPGAITKTIAARIRAHRQSKGLGYLKVPTFKNNHYQIDESDPKVVPKPTLQIQKKEGTYWITMNPLKDPKELVENEDPYMDCTPMTFKITKNKKPQEDLCYCDGPPDDAALSSSSDSELDIEFTPPAGIIHPERFKKRPNVACCEVQYDPKDFEVQNKKGKEGAKKGKEKGKKGKEGKGDKKAKKK